MSNQKDKLKILYEESMDYARSYRDIKKVTKPSEEVDCFSLAVDYLLANGVIVLPCKVGDTVYLICTNDWGDVENYTITEFVQDRDGLFFVVNDEDRERHSVDLIGKTVFLTREEAEQALERRC